MLSYGRMVEDVGISPTSTGCRPVVSYSVTDPPLAPPLRLSRRSSTLEASRSVLSYEGVKMESRLGLPPSRNGFASRWFVCFTLRDI
jgi:hypothetical protein